MTEAEQATASTPDRLDQAISKLVATGFPMLAAEVEKCRADRDDYALRLTKMRHLVGLVDEQNMIADEDGIRAAERAAAVDEVVADLVKFRELAGGTVHDNLRKAIERVSRHGKTKPA